jgi:sulfopyruvate decarboxylase TPP-binding subunit
MHLAIAKRGLMKAFLKAEIGMGRLLGFFLNTINWLRHFVLTAPLSMLACFQ